jgi:hypothetical protein
MTPSIFPTPGGVCTISGYNFGTSAPNVQVNVNNQGKRSELIDEPPKNVFRMYSRMYVRSTYQVGLQTEIFVCYGR